MMAQKKTVGIGLVGAGFMGRCHANAFHAVSGLFDLPVQPITEVLSDATPELAEKSAQMLGFNRAAPDWQSLCNDPKVDIVAVTAPNRFHEPIVLEAIAAGKAVYCEKPLSVTAESAERMTLAAEKAGTLTMVGFNFQRNPMIKLAREIISGGEIGDVVSFSGRHCENYMCDPDAPHSFRTDPEGGGALADIGSHIIAMARYLVGPIGSVAANSATMHKSRPIAAGSSETRPVVVDDVTHSLVAFANGCKGSIEANWAATGRTMDLSFEITGTNGAICFSQERMNELRVTKDGNKPGRAGFVRIESGPAHPPYGQFCPAPGHHLGFNDLKIIEVAELLAAFAGGPACGPDFREALEVQKVVEAMQQSAANGCHLIEVQ